MIGGTRHSPPELQAPTSPPSSCTLKPWDERKPRDLQLDAILARAQQRVRRRTRGIHLRLWFASHPGVEQHRRISVHAGRPRAAASSAQLQQRRRRAGGCGPQAARARQRRSAPSAPTCPLTSIDMDLDKLETLGVPVSDAYNTLANVSGRSVCERLQRFGHTWQVLIQAEPEFRDQPSRYRSFLRAQHGRKHGAARAPWRPSSRPPAPKWCIAITAFAPCRFWARPAPGISSGRPSTRWKRLRRRRCPPATATNGPEPPISKSWRKDTKA